MRPPLSKSDVVIIGGGITGSSILGFLAESGVNVVLVEKEQLGSGSSGRNTGLVWVGTNYHYSTAKKVFGADRAKTLWKLTVENKKLIEKMTKKLGVECVRSGLFVCASSSGENKVLAESVVLMKDELSISSKRSDLPRELREKISDDLLCYYFKDALYLNCSAFFKGIKLRYQDKIFESVNVKRINDTAGGLKLVTDQGDITCDAVVLAVDSASRILHNFFTEVVFPVRQQMFRNNKTSQPLIMNGMRMICVGNGIISSGKNSSEFVSSVYPSAKREPDRIIGFSCDELPNVGPIPGSVNILACAGYQGCELNLAIVCARMVADIILNGSTKYPIKMFNMRRHT